MTTKIRKIPANHSLLLNPCICNHHFGTIGGFAVVTEVVAVAIIIVADIITFIIAIITLCAYTDCLFFATNISSSALGPCLNLYTVRFRIILYFELHRIARVSL